MTNMEHKILVSLIVAGVLITSFLSGLVFAREVLPETTCLIVDSSSGAVVDSFKTHQGDFGCQSLIGFCDSYTCKGDVLMAYVKENLK